MLLYHQEIEFFPLLKNFCFLLVPDDWITLFAYLEVVKKKSSKAIVLFCICISNENYATWLSVLSAVRDFCFSMEWCFQLKFLKIMIERSFHCFFAIPCVWHVVKILYEKVPPNTIHVDCFTWCLLLFCGLQLGLWSVLNCLWRTKVCLLYACSVYSSMILYSKDKTVTAPRYGWGEGFIVDTRESTARDIWKSRAGRERGRTNMALRRGRGWERKTKSRLKRAKRVGQGCMA